LVDKNRLLFPIFWSLAAQIGLLTATLGLLLAQPAQSKDVTGAVELLGNPTKTKYPSGTRIYARNPWDLQVYDGRIYLGNGDSVSNAGPAEIISFNPQTEQFVKEYTSNDEQIEKYRVVEGKLVTPGRDGRQSWDNGNFYRLESGGWQRYNNLPGARHAYDVVSFNNLTFAGLASSKSHIVVSGNKGASWSTALPQDKYGTVYNLFKLQGKLYANGTNFVQEYNGSRFSVKDTKFFAAGERFRYTNTPPIMVRTETFGNKLVYVLGKIANHTQWTPLNLSVATSPTNVTTVSLPGKAKPWDVICRKSKCYVLGAIYNSPGNYTVTVSQTSNLTQWNELFRFKAETFARSFEMDGSGNFYFGLGTEISPISPATGDILRVPRSAW
jgi:hypothetical protein